MVLKKEDLQLGLTLTTTAAFLGRDGNAGTCNWHALIKGVGGMSQNLQPFPASFQEAKSVGKLTGNYKSQ